MRVKIWNMSPEGKTVFKECDDDSPEAEVHRMCERLRSGEGEVIGEERSLLGQWGSTRFRVYTEHKESHESG